MGRRRFEPEHFGAWLKSEFLGDYELSPAQFATAIRVPLERVERVLAGLESIDADLALRLAKLFGGSADGWLRWQQGYELWHAHECAAEEIDTIVPLDPNVRVSVRKDDPLEPELVEELQRRMDDVRDARRWVVVSRIFGDDAPLHEKSLTRMFYNVESGCYSPELRGATAFKRESAAAAVAKAIGERTDVVEVTKQDLEKPLRDEAIDREVRERFFRNTGQGMSEWDIGTYLRDEADMTAYLEAAAEDAAPKLIAAAVGDVMKAMKTQTTVEYLEARGQLGSREAYERAMARVRDVES